MQIIPKLSCGEKCTNDGDIKHEFGVCKWQPRMLSGVSSIRSLRSGDSTYPGDRKRARHRNRCKQISQDVSNSQLAACRRVITL